MSASTPERRWLRRLGNSAPTWVAAFAMVGAMSLTACEEDTSPSISKFEVDPDCEAMRDFGGEEYLEVRFFGRATGGNRVSDPTGANTPLNWMWDMGDGTKISNQVTGAHRYTQVSPPEGYLVRLSVTDDDGDEATAEKRVIVGSVGSSVDVLSVTAEFGDFCAAYDRADGGVAEETCDDTLTFAGFDLPLLGHLDTPCIISGLTEQYRWRWDTGDDAEILHDDNPVHRFALADQTYSVTLEVTEVSSQTVRTFVFDITTPSQPGSSPDPCIEQPRCPPLSK